MAQHRIVRGFDERLADAIYKSGLDIGEVARKIGISRSLLWSYLYDGKTPSSFNLMRIAQTLNVKTDWLLGIGTERTLNPNKDEIRECAIKILDMVTE